MLFTWSTKNLCIVFSTWRITGPVSLLLSLSVIVLLAAGYEGIRDVTRRFEASHARQLKAYSSPVNAGMLGSPFMFCFFSSNGSI
jgi:solute carrier family 31 (copper transporter), member 1